MVIAANRRPLELTISVHSSHLLRVAARRINALDPVDRLAGHPELLNRAHALHAEIAVDRSSIPPRALILAALAGDAVELTTKPSP
jgi:hypothetical protein